MNQDWLKEQAEYEEYLLELEREAWERNSVARMADTAFAAAVQLRNFFCFSDWILRAEFAGKSSLDPWQVWTAIRDSNRRWSRLNDAPLSRWLGRMGKFSVFISRAKGLVPADLPSDRAAVAVQSLIKSWTDEMACFSLGRQTPWQSITFFYSIESSLATVVTLLSTTNITSHADVLNSFRSLIVTPMKGSLFAPVDFSYRRVNKGDWVCDWNTASNSLVEMCPLVVHRAQAGNHGDWITYFHLLHAVSELYRYKTTLPFLMTRSPRLRRHDVFLWDLNLALKLWLEAMITIAIGSDVMADIVKLVRHQILRYHRPEHEHSSLELRWKLMEENGLLDLSKRRLSPVTHDVLQIIRRSPMDLPA